MPTSQERQTSYGRWVWSNACRVSAIEELDERKLKNKVYMLQSCESASLDPRAPVTRRALRVDECKPQVPREERVQPHPASGPNSHNTMYAAMRRHSSSNQGRAHIARHVHMHFADVNHRFLNSVSAFPGTLISSKSRVIYSRIATRSNVHMTWRATSAGPHLHHLGDQRVTSAATPPGPRAGQIMLATSPNAT